MEDFKELTQEEENYVKRLQILQDFKLQSHFKYLKNMSISNLSRGKLEILKEVSVFEEFNERVQNLLIYPQLQSWQYHLEKALETRIEIDHIHEKIEKLKFLLKFS